jgi:hypothetical protein
MTKKKKYLSTGSNTEKKLIEAAAYMIFSMINRLTCAYVEPLFIAQRVDGILEAGPHGLGANDHQSKAENDCSRQWKYP